MPQSSKVWDRLADRYAKSPVANENAYQKKLQITRRYLQPDMDVLEFGCGTGSTAIVHAPYVNHITAIDVSAKMLKFARGKTDAANIKNITFSQSGIEEFAAVDQSFDVVMGHSILHLLADKEKVIGQIYKILKPGGIFISSTTCVDGKARFLQPVLWLGNFLGLLPLVRFFSVSDLESSLSVAGFKISHKWQPKKDSAVFFVATKPA